MAVDMMPKLEDYHIGPLVDKGIEGNTNPLWMAAWEMWHLIWTSREAILPTVYILKLERIRECQAEL
jgi:hypothetical protein